MIDADATFADAADKSNQAAALAEADLLTCTARLMSYVRSGTPAVILAGGDDDAATVLSTIVGAVESGDLSLPNRSAWEAVKAGRLPVLPDRVVANGLGIGFYAPVAARRVLAISQARENYREGLSQAAAALETIIGA